MASVAGPVMALPLSGSTAGGSPAHQFIANLLCFGLSRRHAIFSPSGGSGRGCFYPVRQARVADPVVQELDQPFLADFVEE